MSYVENTGQFKGVKIYSVQGITHRQLYVLRNSLECLKSNIRERPTGDNVTYLRDIDELLKSLNQK